MERDLQLNIKNQSRVIVGSSEILLAELLKDKARFIIITDANIDRIYGARLPQCDRIIIGVGESSKNLQTVEMICRRLLEFNADRSTFLLGVGGGVVSDITGFVAAIYMRGIEFGFVSTTLLSQVDAGVGGKNGVNFDGFKNMIGTFLQPKFVICDPAMLSSLSEREFRSGMAEIIKSAIISSKSLFEQLEKCDITSLREDSSQLSQIIFDTIKIKADIVERDERETGERRKLNLGHTFAHAIEKSSTVMNHGEAVAVGISLVAKMSKELGLLCDSDFERIISILTQFGFELQSPVSMAKMLKLIVHDKKAYADIINMVLPVAISDCEVRRMTIEEISELNKPLRIESLGETKTPLI